MSPETIVLEDDDLDLLELVRGGAIPSEALCAELPDGSVLLDCEGTPVADVHDRRMVLRRELTQGRGACWQGAFRRAAPVERARLAGRDVVAVVVDELPTRNEQDAVGKLATEREVVVVVPAARAEPRRSAALVRAAQGMARSLGSSDVLVVPWPISGAGRHLRGAPTLEVALGAFGLGVAVRSSSMRDQDVEAAVRSLDARRRGLVDDLYPPASAVEVDVVGPPPHQGTVVLFTGLSGSGKSTVARALVEALGESGSTATLLDGDVVRRCLSGGLGFDRAGREENLARIGWVAALVSEHGGIAVAAPIAPFAESRARIRQAALEHGRFVLVHVSTPLEECERRDRKGLYAAARRGEIADFTGISSPYDVPQDADVVIDTVEVGVDDAVRQVLAVVSAR
ncbi:sulfate adenylyltransferase [Sediminihabitans luteus]|uniref:Adenylyl-sulfate kinase n=1 Tax=Sediminihabitans luteus TaxID=1138585 RepID=A0A2M9CE46_9CELL|nr:adenylyl-sulfate kinase [Sediminihabitans luteus]PJJ70159.1 sulfate adenylyltransferase [Sediminihabitans luteus]GII97630.1 hypothetical protein Slu03_00080 [Sediminihabitans luteus]